MHLTGNSVLQCMAKRTVANVMQQDCAQERDLLFVRNLVALQPQLINGILHEVHCANGVLEAVMKSSGVYQMRQPQLCNTAQPLKPRMINQFKDKRMTNGNESIDRVVYDFSFKWQGNIIVTQKYPMQ